MPGRAEILRGFRSPHGEQPFRMRPFLAAGAVVLAVLVGSARAADTGTLIVRLVTDRALAEHLARAGRAHALTAFSMDAMVERYTSLFASLAPAGADQEKSA